MDMIAAMTVRSPCMQPEGQNRSGRFAVKVALFTAILFGMAVPVRAEVALEGWLIATKTCPAVQSIRKGTNPGDAKVEEDRAYRLFAKNNEPASHYLIAVKGAEPERRWVATDCGFHVVAASGAVTPPPPEPQPQPQPQPQPTPGATQYVLAASWQPGFCETRPSKPECSSQTEDRFDATNLALHGLWPQPRSNVYCNVSSGDIAADKDGRWDALPGITLEPATKQALDKVMPGTQSKLERHEWIKHGTCHGGTTQEYYADSIRLMEAVNASAVRTLFADHIGREITANDIRDAFDQSFGAGAGERVKVSCVNDGNRRLIGEITVGLSGELEEGADFAQLLFASPPTDAGCPKGIVDAAGLQ